MADTTYRGRRAASIENADLRVTVLEECGHIAEIFEKKTGINPLWSPPWPSIEPSNYDPAKHPEYGANAESKLLAGIMGHNLCLDLFGGPSAEEAAAGHTVHGEGSIAPYDIRKDGERLLMEAHLLMAQLRFERSIELRGNEVRIAEMVENLSTQDRPIAWTQHVTLGPPFLERGVTQFRTPATRSKVYESAFGAGDYLKPAAEFDWPMAPRLDGKGEDLRVMNRAEVSGGYTTHLMDPGGDAAFFVAYHPVPRLAFGYVWKRSDFPWLGIWEENHSRTQPPWNRQTLARGMEFGVSPIPESRRAMIGRRDLFGVPAYRWLPAKSKLSVNYAAKAWRTDAVPESMKLPGGQA